MGALRRFGRGRGVSQNKWSGRVSEDEVHHIPPAAPTPPPRFLGTSPLAGEVGSTPLFKGDLPTQTDSKKSGENEN